MIAQACPPTRGKEAGGKGGRLNAAGATRARFPPVARRYEAGTGEEQDCEGEESGKRGGRGRERTPAPALPCPGAAPAQRGGGGRSRPHPRPGRSARLSPATAAGPAPYVAPRREARGCRRRGSHRHRLSPALVAATTTATLTPGSSSRRRRRRLWAPGSGPAFTPARRANQARHHPSRHRPAGPAAWRPKFGEGRAPACLPVGARDLPRLVLLLASRDPPGPPGPHVVAPLAVRLMLGD
ncbi:translation initiation factor IF-2-like [Lontra canadensis]|uniref:translation initiation factor IF-2-like n=1 Tax=Lontra canadensis TaxID=76717 RepID=UPI0013F3520C|nr:translation initiation factor IF-2-like [Lontra canadensis]